MTKDCSSVFDELDLIKDAYLGLEALSATSEVELSVVFPILFQLNRNFEAVLNRRASGVKASLKPVLVSSS